MQNEMFDRALRSQDIDFAALQRTHLAIIGAGGLGSEISLKLAGSGIERLTIVEPDRVSAANIPHTSVFTQKDIGKQKARVLRRILKAKFPWLDVEGVPLFIQQCEPDFFTLPDLYVVCPDNNDTRRHVNYYAVANKKPAVFVGLGGPGSEWEGYCYVYQPGVSGCFACFLDAGEQRLATTDTIAQSGDIELDRHRCGGENEPVPTLAPVVGCIASIASSLVVKLLCSLPFLSYTAVSLKEPYLQTLAIKPLPTCVVCGTRQEYDLAEVLDRR